MKIKLVSLMLCTLALSACNQGGQENANEAVEPSAETAAAPAAPAPDRSRAPKPPKGSILIASEVGEGAGSPLRLASNQSVSGSYTPTYDGSLVAFGVYIGNSRRTSDGSLTLNLCQAQDCQDVTLPLKNTKDNAFLVFTLARPLTVTTGGQPLTYKLVRSADATKTVAIWTYPPAAGAVALTGPAGEDTGRVAKVAMYLQGEI